MKSIYEITLCLMYFRTLSIENMVKRRKVKGLYCSYIGKNSIGHQLKFI